MTRSIWQGHKVRLRAVEPDDWEHFYAWNLDDVVSRAAEGVSFPQSQEAVRRWTERVAMDDDGNDRFRWMIVDEHGTPVGTINTHSCDRRSGTFSYGIALAPEAQGHGYAAEASRLVLRHFFIELGYQKATVHIYSFNEPSRVLALSLGYVQEGRLRRMFYAGGRHWDTLVYGLTREEFEAGDLAELPSFPTPEEPITP